MQKTTKLFFIGFCILGFFGITGCTKEESSSTNNGNNGETSNPNAPLSLVGTKWVNFSDMSQSWNINTQTFTLSFSEHEATLINEMYYYDYNSAQMNPNYEPVINRYYNYYSYTYKNGKGTLTNDRGSGSFTINNDILDWNGWIYERN